MKKYRLPLFLWFLFEAVALGLWLATGRAFYIFNFSYIGICLVLGSFLYIKGFKYARNFILLAIGLYMLVYLGIIKRENMQIEGFWYYLLGGTFTAAVLHYGVAKIFGPLLFGRGWCGYACWTAMILDLLPYRAPKSPRRNLSFISYIVFGASLFFVAVLYIFKVPDLARIIFISFIIGNILYYGAGIILAYKLKDNRAFCKYICPVAVFLRPAGYYSLLRVKYDAAKCINCDICLDICPMDVNMKDNFRGRKNGTDCILCMKCVDKCPAKALHI